MRDRSIGRGSALRALATAVLLTATALLVPLRVHAGDLPTWAAGRGGAVASDEALASEVGVEVLRRGGNAVDAAVATALVLAVVHPEAGNLGGGGFAVVNLGDHVTSLDFRETAPAAACHDTYLDEEGRPRPEASTVGPLAAGVPGSITGLRELHRRFGRLPWREIVLPAVRLAAEGFKVSPRTHRSLVNSRDLLARFPESAAVWLPGGEPPAPGDRMRLPALAATLRAYAEGGPEAITRGPLAGAVEAAAREHGGILSAEDLDSYRPVWRPALRFDAFGWELAAMDLPASGGILLAQAFALLERLEWARRGPIDRAHLLAEVFRRGFADRFFLGDPAGGGATATNLLDPSWVLRRAAEIRLDSASESRTLAMLAGAEPVAAAEGRDTTHVAVADHDGNLATLTTTLNDAFGCGLLVPEAGFFLNNEMDDFATAPGQPNLFGLLQGEANAVAPGRRMLSSMTPVLVWRPGTALAAGGRGGSQIPTATAQVLLHVLVDGRPLVEAVSAPRLHHQWLPDRVLLEDAGHPAELRAGLAARGHEVEVGAGPWRVNAVLRRGDGSVEAVADPRGPGYGRVEEPPSLPSGEP